MFRWGGSGDEGVTGGDEKPGSEGTRATCEGQS